MAKRPGNVDLGYIEHVHQRARTLGVDDLSVDPIEDFVTENLQDHIRCLQHATQRAWTREFNDWCAVNHKTPITGQEVCTLVDEFLEATPEKPHKKQLKLLGRFLCQRETLFTNYNQGMRCQWCKTPQSSEMLLSLLYPTALSPLMRLCFLTHSSWSHGMRFFLPLFVSFCLNHASQPKFWYSMSLGWISLFTTLFDRFFCHLFVI